MVFCFEMADDLERTAEEIAEDEKADQQNDNSRQHKMALERTWSGSEKYHDLLSCAKLGKCPSFCRSKFLFILLVVS